MSTFEKQKSEFVLLAKEVGKKLTVMADHIHLINSASEWLHCKTKVLEEIGSYYCEEERVTDVLVASHEVI